MVQPSIGVILTAGLGSRMAPLNVSRPKALMPLCNRPLLEYQFDTLLALGVTEIILQIGATGKEPIVSYISQRVHQPRLRNVRFSYIYDEMPTTFSMPLLKERIHTGFVLLDCDRVSQFPVMACWRFHEERSAICTWALAPAVGTGTAAWKATDDGRITQYKKQGDTDSYEHTGLILATPEFIESMVNPKDRFPFGFGSNQPWYGYAPQSAQFWEHAPSFDVMPNARWFAYPASVYAIDVGVPSRYLRAHFDALCGKAPFIDEIYNQPYTPLGWIHPSAQISPSARLIPPYLIGENAQIDAGCAVGPLAVVGNQCMIGCHSIVERSVLWDRVHVQIGVSLDHCVIADDLEIVHDAKNVFIASDSGSIQQKRILERDVHTEVAQIWEG